MIHFGNNALLPGVWIATATSLPLGNIEIDQAVVSTIAARIAAAKVMLVRMTPTSGSVPPQDFIWRLRCRKECELPHTDRRLLGTPPPSNARVVVVRASFFCECPERFVGFPTYSF